MQSLHLQASRPSYTKVPESSENVFRHQEILENTKKILLTYDILTKTVHKSLQFDDFFLL